MLVVQSHSSACPEHTRYLQRRQLRSCQAAGTVGPRTSCHLACEPGTASTTPLGGAPPKTPCTSKQLLWSKATQPPRGSSAQNPAAAWLWLHGDTAGGTKAGGWHSLMGVTASQVAQPHGWHSLTGDTRTRAGLTKAQCLEMHLPGVLARKGRWILPHAWSPARAREHGDAPLCPLSATARHQLCPALRTLQDGTWPSQPH